jgi:hypothetical protein
MGKVETKMAGALPHTLSLEGWRKYMIQPTGRIPGEDGEPSGGFPFNVFWCGRMSHVAGRWKISF